MISFFLGSNSLLEFPLHSPGYCTFTQLFIVRRRERAMISACENLIHLLFEVS
jgi:hypothetical protein